VLKVNLGGGVLKHPMAHTQLCHCIRRIHQVCENLPICRLLVVHITPHCMIKDSISKKLENSLYKRGKMEVVCMRKH